MDSEKRFDEIQNELTAAITETFAQLQQTIVAKYDMNEFLTNYYLGRAAINAGVKCSLKGFADATDEDVVLAQSQVMQAFTDFIAGRN